MLPFLSLTHTHVYISISIHIYTSIHIHMYVCVCVCVSVYLFVCMYIYTYTHTNKLISDCLFKKIGSPESHQNIWSCSHFLFSTISLCSSPSDVSHGEHDRKAGELWCSKTGHTAQFTATLGSSTVQLPLTTTFPLRRHPPQGQGALRLQVSALWCSVLLPALIRCLPALCSVKCLQCW